MNKLRSITLPFQKMRISLVRIPVAVCAGLLMPPMCLAVTTDDGEPKDHVLFMGLNLFVHDEVRSGRVQNVDNDSAELVEEGRRTSISLRDVRTYNVTREPKISSVVVHLDKLIDVRTFSPRQDPMLAATRQKAMMDGVSADQQQHYNRALSAALAVDDLPAAGAGAVPSPIPQLAEEQRRQVAAVAQERLADAQRDLDTGSYDPNFNIQSGAKKLGQGLYDTLQVSFEISSEEPLNDAYAVLVSSIVVPGMQKTPVNAVMVQALPKITSKPRTIRLTHEGLPSGYELQEYEVHIYSGIRELATNLSPRRLELTASDAFQYRLGQYLLANRRKSHEPQLLTEFLPPEITDRITGDHLERSARVAIDDGGSVVRVQLMPEGADSTDHYVESAIRQARFLPALLDGEPVEGEVILPLIAFVR